jgi:hypothetical protein
MAFNCRRLCRYTLFAFIKGLLFFNSFSARIFHYSCMLSTESHIVTRLANERVFLNMNDINDISFFGTSDCFAVL